jgi:hypothetical protein
VTDDTHGEHINVLPYLRKKARVYVAGSYREKEGRYENDARSQNSTQSSGNASNADDAEVSQREHEGEGEINPVCGRTQKNQPRSIGG